MFKYYLSISVLWWNGWFSKSVTALIAISFIQYPLIIPSLNLDLDETKLKNLINFKFNIFFLNYNLIYFILLFSFLQKIERSTILIDQGIEIQCTQVFESCLNLV